MPSKKQKLRAVGQLLISPLEKVLSAYEDRLRYIVTMDEMRDENLKVVS